MSALKNVSFKDREIENERLELTDKSSLYFLGPRLTLKHCILVLKASARSLILRETRMIDCTIEIKQELKNHQQWVYTALNGCRFKGRLSGCDFGRWPGYGEWWEHGSIEDCDFTEARLDGCRFMGCNPSSLRLPHWPCFTILDPLRAAPTLRGIHWPGASGALFLETLLKSPPPTAAVTFFAPSEAKRLETTLDELRAVMETLDCVIL